MKVFLAGTSGEQKNADIIRASPYILESFYYIKPWQYELIHTSKMFLLDSGAFTFFSNGKNQDWNEYLIRYADFINKHDVQYFFELDIDDLIGYERVLELRKKLVEYTGKKPIPVWHISRGKQDYIDMCKEFDYVAIGGLVGTESNSKRQKLLEKSFPWFINVAHKNGAKIHALGYTKVKTFEQYHFDSVDSTRWNCSRFGRLEYFDGKTIQPLDKRKEGKCIKKGDSAKKVMRFTFGEWIKFQKY